MAVAQQAKMGVINKLVVISGHSGLFKIVAEHRTTLVAELLNEPQKRITVLSSAKMSLIEHIVIFAENEEVPLITLLTKMKALVDEGKKLAALDGTADEIKSFFELALPNYDRNRFHISDMKKILRWFTQLQASGNMSDVLTQNAPAS